MADATFRLQSMQADMALRSHAVDKQDSSGAQESYEHSSSGSEPRCSDSGSNTENQDGVKSHQAPQTATTHNVLHASQDVSKSQVHVQSADNSADATDFSKDTPSPIKPMPGQQSAHAAFEHAQALQADAAASALSSWNDEAGPPSPPHVDERNVAPAGDTGDHELTEAHTEADQGTAAATSACKGEHANSASFSEPTPSQSPTKIGGKALHRQLPDGSLRQITEQIADHAQEQASEQLTGPQADSRPFVSQQCVNNPR